jgi:hypothetical protein
MRPASIQPSQGALPPAFGSPRDISLQYESTRKSFHTGKNIPAGGSNAARARHAAEPGAQNSFLKNFDFGGARR